MITKISVLLALFCLAAAVCPAASKPPVSDDMITNHVMLKLSGDAVVKGGALKVDVKDGVVTLSGAVADQKQKERAGKLTRKVKGVKDVVNNITIEKTPPR